METHEATRLTGAIAVHDGLAFVPAASWEESRAVDPAYPCCTFRGSLSALQVRDGKVAWKTWLVPEPKQTHVTAAGTKRYGPSGVGVWSAPAIDAARGLLYVGTGNDYTHPATPLSDAVLAIEMKTGRIALVAPDHRRRTCSTRSARAAATRTAAPTTTSPRPSCSCARRADANC